MTRRRWARCGSAPGRHAAPRGQRTGGSSWICRWAAGSQGGAAGAARRHLQQAQLQQAVAQEGIARTQLQRNRDLVAQNFVTQSALDQAVANLEVAQTLSGGAGTCASAAPAHPAPFDGTMGIRSVNVGDYVKDGADLVQIEDTSGLLVDIRLPERYSSRLRAGQVVSVRSMRYLVANSQPGWTLLMPCSTPTVDRCLRGRA